MSLSRIFVRTLISAAFVLLSLVCLPFLLVFKVWEGFILVYESTRDSIVQIWKARGLEGLDK